MYSAQLQLGMLYLGLFGATAFLLYLQVSALRSMPPHATLAIVFVTAFCAVIPIYRRSRFVDRNLITEPPSNTGGAARDSSGARVLSRLQRILNVCITVLAALVVVVALMELYLRRPRGHRPRQRRGIAGGDPRARHRVGGVDPAAAVLSDRRHDELAKDRGFREGPGREPGRVEPMVGGVQAVLHACTPPRVLSRGCSCAHSAPSSWCRRQRPAIRTSCRPSSPS